MAFPRLSPHLRLAVLMIRGTGILKNPYGLIVLVLEQTGIIEVNWLCASSWQSIC